MNASHNSRGPEDDESSFFNNMAASRNQAGPENDEARYIAKAEQFDFQSESFSAVIDL